MVAIMRDALGVGLAATQLGVLRRLLVFQAGPDAAPTAVANPRARVALRGARTAEEGCLSLPGIGVDVERPLHARVTRPSTSSGEPLLLEASGLEARVLQHEIDHLDGVLILDRTEREQRKGALRALREGDHATARSRRARSREPEPTTSEDRLPRHLRLRRRDPAPARRRPPHRPRARRHPARPPPGPRAQGSPRRRPPRPPRELGIELLQTEATERARGARADPRRRARASASSAPSAS